jgi:hypothetical protein
LFVVFFYASLRRRVLGGVRVMQRVHAVKFKNELIISVDRNSHKIQCPALC